MGVPISTVVAARAREVNMDDIQRPGWALVTGACSGIGLQIAMELAARGYSLVMVSNRARELQAAARKVTSLHRVEAIPLAMDLAQPDAADALYAELNERGLRIEVLVSNAGFLMSGDVADVDPRRAADMMRLHVVTPSLLAHHLGKEMRARRSGYMMFTSSIAAWRSSPGIAHYCSSKRFLLHFTRALRDEMREHGVTVTCLAPGAVTTPLYDGTRAPLKRAVKFGVMKRPEKIARKAVAAMFKGKARVVPCLSAKFMIVATALTPRWLLRRMRKHSPLLPSPERSAGRCR